MLEKTNEDLVDLAAQIITAYVANNSVQVAALPELIASVHRAVSGLHKSTMVTVESENLSPAVNRKKSVFPDYIICLDDGRRFKSLKRHLTGLGMTPSEYRAKWRLPADYPMTAPSYAAFRSGLAKSIGLGRKPQEPIRAPPAKRGRP